MKSIIILCLFEFTCCPLYVLLGVRNQREFYVLTTTMGLTTAPFFIFTRCPTTRPTAGHPVQMQGDAEDPG